jgi:formylglycine-generating enzyme required for sulfatase activity
VESVSWNKAQEFIKALNRMEKTDKYRLPTEAEWEYACRAETTSRWFFGNDEAKLGEYAWYGKNSGAKTHPVGQKEPNAWGLYDMLGNVWEWCQDWYGKYPDGPVTDPKGPASGQGRVLRGGSWGGGAGGARSAYRSFNHTDLRYRDDIGFRVARAF